MYLASYDDLFILYFRLEYFSHEQTTTVLKDIIDTGSRDTRRSTFIGYITLCT